MESNRILTLVSSSSLIWTTLLLLHSSEAIDFQTSGNVQWGFNCDFANGDLRNQRSAGSECGGICYAEPSCTHFTWTSWNNGTCFLKGAGVNPTAIVKNTDNAVCGWVNRDSGGGGLGPRWPYGTQKVKGVNLGSWLILEKWITPQVFQGLPDNVDDEYKLCQNLGKVEAEKRLRPHWDSWVTEQDFVFFKSAGLNHVRIPIGYWALDIKAGEPWVSGSWDYVVKAAGWAKKYGIQVMLDLHGAPGSQNGNDHSGQSGNIGFYNSDENISRAVAVLKRMASWANTAEWRDTVTIIQLLNEPILWGTDYNYRLGRLKDFYRRAYDEIRSVNDRIVVAVHDAFIDASNWYYLRDDAHYRSVMLDMHIYQVFGDQWGKMTCDQHYYHPCSYANKLREANGKLWTVVGEWSLSTPANLNCNNKSFYNKQQTGAFESNGSGWIFWAHKNGQGWRDWSFKDSFEAGWIRPQDNNQLQC